MKKKIFHSHLPVRVPCYDFILVTDPTVDIRLLDNVKVHNLSSGQDGSQHVTGGVYKTEERIHRRIADRRLLAIPAS
jgi:hypothetical protein